MKRDTKKQIDKLLSSKELHIKALTAAGILTGIVTDIHVTSSNSSNEEDNNFLDILLSQISNDVNIAVNTDSNSVIYTVENTRLYPISNLEEFVFLDIIDLSSSKIIALCPLFEEVD